MKLRNNNILWISIIYLILYFIISICTILFVQYVLRDTCENTQNLSILSILISFFIGLIISISGLLYLRRKYHRDLLGFSPAEMALLYSENKSIIDQLHEGIITIDPDYNIRTMNKVSKNMFHIHDDYSKKKIYDLLPSLHCQEIIDKHKPIHNQLITIYDEKVLLSAYPIYDQNKVIGATLLFRSRLEVDMLLDQLSGYRKIAKALREQKHEFKNKLHVIVGLLKMKDYEAVNTYVNQSVYQTNLTSDYYSSRLEDDQISALFVGKDILAKEYETNLKLSSDSYLSLSHNPVSSDDLIIVVGNLIDNAFEAFKEEHKNREVTVKIIEDDQQISIGVLDNAGTLENYMKEEMFQRGVSTKKGENRGTGLYLVNEIIRMYGGEKNVQVSKRKTYIEIILKKVKQ